MSSTDEFFERVGQRRLERDALAAAQQGREHAQQAQLARDREQVARVIAIADELAPRLVAAGCEPELRVAHRRQKLMRRLIGAPRIVVEMSATYAEGWLLATDRGWITGSLSPNDSRIGGMGQSSRLALIETILDRTGRIHVYATTDRDRFNDYAAPLEPRSRGAARSNRELWKPQARHGTGLVDPVGAFGDSSAVVCLTRAEQYPLPPIPGDTERRSMPFSPGLVERGLEELALEVLTG